MSAARTPAAPLRGGEALRYLWTQLTSMRTALVLLFALAVAAIPGSILPQRPVNAFGVTDFQAANPVLGRLYAALGLFDVFGSPWFAAIYLLLLVSLVGCILPRLAQYARAVKAPPPRAPLRLDRLPEHAAGATTLDPAQALDAGEAWLRAHRFRVRRDGASVGGERGYVREFGNLLFHVSLLVLLAGVAAGALLGYRGSVVVVEGQAFSNNLSQYDDFGAGGSFDPSRLAPFTIWVDSFVASFELGPVQHGAARQFSAHVRIAGATGDPVADVIEVNSPARIGGASVHLVGHGYAPVVTVTDANGDVASSGPVPFLPQDGNFSSIGVVKAPDARPRRLAFECLFLPTATVDDQGPRSVFPDAFAPELFCNAWTGPPKVETGRPENVYSLDKTGLTQVGEGGRALSFRLSPGQVRDLPDGSRIAFDNWLRWTRLQVSDTPGLPLVFGSVLAGILGLCLTLFVRPRRLWVRVGQDGELCRVEVGGLDRADARTGLADDVAALAAASGVRQSPGVPASALPSTRT